ncbi:MAG TPA: hypothetical protein VN936_12430 [Candidatus Acidoferrum sp.]|nr:hypothetical protein [Candidatus Acidoferrum sp.]
MTHGAVPLCAGIFVGLFGLVGASFIGRRFPNARWLRAGYLIMGFGGALFAIWAVTHVLGIGVAAALVVAAGAAIGAIGALRKELRESL